MQKKDMDTLTLSDILVDQKTLQTMMEEFHRVTGIGGAILDISGKILLSFGWQDVCRKFHRAHPETLKNCKESDLFLAGNVSSGSFKAYRCKNHLWDMVTPIEVEGRHLGNLYLGQFFYEDDLVDLDFFREQARKYGFDEKQYLEAIDRVPRWKKEVIHGAMGFCVRLAEMIASLSFSGIRFSKALFEQESVLTKLQESEARYHGLFECIQDAIVVVDAQRNIIDANEAFIRLFGYSTEDIKGRKSRFLYENEEDFLHVGKVMEENGEKLHFVKVLNHVRKNGEIFPSETRVASLRTPDGELWGFFGVIRDISAQVKAQKEREILQEQLHQSKRMESIGRMAGGVAHDYNNMLGLIIGHAELAMDQLGSSDSLYSHLQSIHKAAGRSADITKQLLAFARRQPASPKVLDMNAFVSDMFHMLQRLMGENIKLSWCPAEKPVKVKVDPSQLDQILVHLCTNARDAISSAGRVIIETGRVVFDEDIRTRHADFIPGDYVMLAVSDDGCGMEQDMLLHLFEPFFTTKDVAKGCGLGLAMVYGIVKQNKGFIHVYSEPGDGTSFRIYLPRHSDEEKDLSASMKIREEGSVGETILLVEDEPALLKMARIMLERQGYKVLEAGLPVEALRLAAEHHSGIDLLLTDVVMPEMNGWDLAAELRSRYPGMKCMFMSGYTANYIAENGVLDESVHFIQKPFSMKEMAVSVRKALDS
ncbi:PocR ligand-binding domain-containing protein [Desulfobotulus mexicanus]|nr:PocR ligand-binding domain-containing protein [Desulfobotulus mexicanus]